MASVSPGTLCLRISPASPFRFAPPASPTAWPRQSGRGNSSAAPRRQRRERALETTVPSEPLRQFLRNRKIRGLLLLHPQSSLLACDGLAHVGLDGRRLRRDVLHAGELHHPPGVHLTELHQHLQDDDVLPIHRVRGLTSPKLTLGGADVEAEPAPLLRGVRRSPLHRHRRTVRVRRPGRDESDVARLGLPRTSKATIAAARSIARAEASLRQDPQGLASPGVAGPACGPETTLIGRDNQDQTKKIAIYEAAVLRLESIRNGYIRRKPGYAIGASAP